MRKWFFIVLPVFIVFLFILIDFLISSGEYSYLSINRDRSYGLNKPSEEGALDPLPVDETNNQSRGGGKTTQNKKSVKTRSTNFSFSSSRDVKSSYSQTSSAGESINSGVVRPKPASLNLSAHESPGSKTSFIAGAPPSVFFSLDFINEQIVDHNLQFRNVPVGGLSALSYNPEKNVFIALSDAKTALSGVKSKKGPPRFYELKLNEVEKGKKYELKIMDQMLLNNKKTGKLMPVDPEGVAFFKPDQMFISSEGAQLPKLNIYVPPSVLMFNSKGEWLSSWPLPDMYWPDDLERLGEWGVKENKAFEALSVNPKDNQLWLATESALNQDEQDEIDSENKQYVRVSQFDITTARMNKQFLYEMDSDIEINNLKGRNGLTDFFSLGGYKLLAIERAYLKDASVSGNRKTDANLVRLFLTDCSAANDVSKYQELKKGRFVTCGKRLLGELSSIIGSRVDNIEGITIGPAVKGGYLLVLVSDNNFNQAQKTQFLFFHYLPDEKSR